MNWSALSWFAMKPVQVVKGTVMRGAELAASDCLLAGVVVVLDEGDMEEAAALELVKRNALAVVHCGSLMNGERLTEGPLVLLQHGIPVRETAASSYALLASHDTLALYPDVIVAGEQTVPCRTFTQADWLGAQQQMEAPQASRCEAFIDRTLAQAVREKGSVLQPFPTLSLQTVMADKPVLLVAELEGYRPERGGWLRKIKRWIKEQRPVIVGIGQGAEQLLLAGIMPDLILGKAEQLTARMLTSGAEVVVQVEEHEEAAGEANLQPPGRVHKLRCAVSTVDAALLLAHHHQAASLVTVGMPVDLAEWVQRGGEDMGSALLVRLQIGARLIDMRSLPQPSGSLWTKEALTTALVSGLFIGFAVLQLHWIVGRAAHAVWRLGFGG